MESNDKIASWIKNLFFTVIGGVILAFIIGEGSLFQDKSLIDHARNLKSTIVVSNSICKIEVWNYLLVPVKVFVDNKYIGTLGANSTQKYTGPFKSKVLSFESITPYSAGLDLSGRFTSPISGNQTFQITNVIGKDYYYLFEINNESGFTCDVYVDKGYVSEKYIGKIDSYDHNFRSGYFQVYHNSNIVLVCSNGGLAYFGQYEDKEIKYRVEDYCDENTGLLNWTIN